MARKRLDVFWGKGMNSFVSPVSTGLQEPITGQQQMSGLVLGDFVEMTRSEALAKSDSSVGTLFEGTYQWVYLDPSAATLKRGQILFWVLGGTYAHQVTNVEPTGVSMIAGIYLGPATGTAGAPSTTNPFFWMQAFQNGVASILFRTTLGNGSPAIGDSVFTAGAGAGTDNATADDLGAVTLANSANYMGRFIGVAEVAPAGATISKVELRGGFIRI